MLGASVNVVVNSTPNVRLTLGRLVVEHASMDIIMGNGIGASPTLLGSAQQISHVRCLPERVAARYVNERGFLQ